MTPTLRNLLAQKPDDEDEKTYRQLVAERLLSIARFGEEKAAVAAIRTIFERIDGKVPDPIELTGKDGGALVLKWTEADIDGDA